MCSLINTSFVPMSFSLRVVGDGMGSPSVTSDQQVCELCRNNWQGSTAHDGSTLPVEFTVSPAVGFVRAMADVSIKVQWTIKFQVVLSLSCPLFHFQTMNSSHLCSTH